MTIAAHFLARAREVLPADTFQAIYAAAVAAERRRLLAPTSVRAEDAVDKPQIAARLEAHLNDGSPPASTEPPHVVQRLEERLDLQVGPAELGKLVALVRERDRNVRLLKRRLETVLECEVAFMGRQFVVVFNDSRGELITAYPKVKKRKKLRLGKPAARDWRREAAEALAEEVTEE